MSKSTPAKKESTDFCDSKGNTLFTISENMSGAWGQKRVSKALMEAFEQGKASCST
jgi:hypothetical protein